MATHQIRRGDTLSALAAKYNTSVSALAKLNNIANPDLIYAGRSLKLPGHNGQSDFQPARPGGKPGGQTGGVSPAEPTGSVVGPNGVKGSKSLADAGRAAAMSMGGYNSQGLCATGVSKAIRSAYGIGVSGNGNQIDNNLPRSKFRQVDMPLSEALKIPGLVLTWERTSTALGSKYGHTAITAGDGHTSYSDFIERNTLAGSGGRSGLKIFMPIS